MKCKSNSLAIFSPSDVITSLSITLSVLVPTVEILLEENDHIALHMSMSNEKWIIDNQNRNNMNKYLPNIILTPSKHAFLMSLSQILILSNDILLVTSYTNTIPSACL